LNRPVQQYRFALAQCLFDIEDIRRQPSRSLPYAYHPFMMDLDGAEPAGSYQVMDAGFDGLKPICSGALQWQCPTWRMGCTDDGQRGIELFMQPQHRWRPVANSSEDFSRGVISAWQGPVFTPAAYALNYPCDQILLMNRLLYRNVLLMHAAGVDDQGNGLLFTGPSDIGKTTLARLWRQQGARLLNDDRMLLRCDRERVLISASPWHGEESEISSGEVPLRTVFILQQARRCAVVPLSAAEALSRLTVNTVAPFYSAQAMSRVLAAWERIVETVPVCRLEFTPDVSAVTCCRAWGSVH
jgi:hypothetical protein